ncbi:hypothetical protein ACLOJK_018446 [Asimina triloba]
MRKSITILHAAADVFVCPQIFVHLQKLMGRSKPTGIEGLSWTILRSRREDSHDVDIDTMVEHHSKLWVALNVLHECFQPFVEPRTKADFFTNVVFNRGSKLKRLNFQGFYTMILEKEEVISVATVRIFGEKVAEIPLIGTHVQYRRLGMCRILMNEIEKVFTAFLLGFSESFFEEKQTTPAYLPSMWAAMARACKHGHSMGSCAGSLLLSGCAPLYGPPHIEHGQKEKHKKVLAKLIKQLIVTELIASLTVSGINRNNTCGFAKVAPPVDMDKKRTTLGLKSYLTRAAARPRVAKTAS